MKILGIYSGHDLGACLLCDGAIAACIAEERLTRVRHGLTLRARGLWEEFNGRFGYFPWASVEYCLSVGGIELGELDAIVLSGSFDRSVVDLLPMRDKKKLLFADEPAGGHHHYMHALSAFYASQFDHAAVLIVDGDGSVTAEGYEAESGYRFGDRSGGYTEVFKNRYPSAQRKSGLGWMYELVSAILGFVDTRCGYMAEPGKTMGLAPYGTPDADLSEDWIALDGMRLDFQGFHDFLDESRLLESASFTSRDRALIQNEARIPTHAIRLAAKVQRELERALLHLVRELHMQTKEKYLCMAGGVALNSVANGLIAATGPFEKVFIQPAAADDGQAIGLAYYGHLKLCLDRPIAPMRHAFGGRSYDRKEMLSLLDRCRFDRVEFPTDEDLAEDAAGALALSQIIGWFQDGSEIGPRALGHRSILADPRDPGMKDYVNARVKFREPFRPLAPSVLAERAQEVFELEGESPYMLIVASVRSAWRNRLGAITHVDGSARIQTVERAVDPLFYALIASFCRRTGVPVVLNTSFNLRGRPIVESPRDALQAFLFAELEAIYLGRLKVRRPSLDHLYPLLSSRWRFSLTHRLEDGRADVEATLEPRDGSVRPIVVSNPLLAGVLSEVNKERSLMAALEAALDGDTPTADDRDAALRGVQELLRKEILQLRVGDVVF
jgi:carbamoyltransferase